MYFSRLSLLRRRCSSSRATCSPSVATRHGSRPHRPSASRSAAVNPASLFSAGWASSAAPCGGSVAVPSAGPLVTGPVPGHDLRSMTVPPTACRTAHLTLAVPDEHGQRPKVTLGRADGLWSGYGRATDGVPRRSPPICQRSQASPWAGDGPTDGGESCRTEQRHGYG